MPTGGSGSPHAVFSPDGQRLVTTSGGRQVYLWDTATGAALALWHQFDAAVHVAVFSPDSRRLVTLVGNTAHVWDVETRARIATLKGHESSLLTAAFGPPTASNWPPERRTARPCCGT